MCCNFKKVGCFGDFSLGKSKFQKIFHSFVSAIVFSCFVIPAAFSEEGEYFLETVNAGALLSELYEEVEVNVAVALGDSYEDSLDAIGAIRSEKVVLPISAFSISIDDSYFTFQQGNHIGVVSTPVYLKPREGERLNFKGMVKSENLMASSLMQSDEKLMNSFMTLSKDGKLDYYSAKSFVNGNSKSKLRQEVLAPFNYIDSKDECSAYFSKDGSCFAVADNKGYVYFYNFNSTSKKYEMQLIKPLSHTHILNVDFSLDGKKFLVFYADSVIRVFDRESFSEISLMRNTQTQVSSVKFNADGNALAFCSDKKTVVIVDLDAKMQKFIPMTAPVKAVEYIFDGNFLAVISERDDIYLFSSTDYEFIGLVSSICESEMTAWAFSSYDNYVLRGYANGEIHKTHLLITDKKGSIVFGSSGKGGAASKIIPVYEDSLCFSGFGTFAMKPFAGGAKVNGEFTFGSKLAPFYLGVQFDVMMQFPSKEFPYIYYENGIQMQSPRCASLGLYMPVGIQLKVLNTPFVFGAELDVGARYIVLYGTTQMLMVNSSVAYTLPTLSFDAGGYMFISLYNIRLTAGVSWDYTIGFTPQLGLGYNFVLNRNN